MSFSAEQLQQHIDWLSSIGADPKGGMTRLLYSPEWLKAQKGLYQKFIELGIQPRFDPIGNLFGRVEGSTYPNETILSGSHIDTVVNGGTLDGQYGIIAAYLAIAYLTQTYGQPLRSLEVVSFAEEEGSRFPTVFWGSKNVVAEANIEQVKEIADINGIKFIDEMHHCGFDFNHKPRLRNDIKAFVEIHIEQGNVLEREQRNIGVVHSIVGQKRYTVVLKGQSNHAGTTPMGYRHDTIYGFSKICTHLIERAKAEGDPLVLTFGRVEPKPNTVNVVPGLTEFTIDCRHTDSQALERFTQEVEQYIQHIAQELGLEAEIDLWMNERPIPMDKNIVDLLEKVAKENQLNYKLMHSGAGHDSQIMAPHFPTAMLFVPSINGISHNPAEKTDIADLVIGVEMLTKALYELAYKD